uniref:CH-like domain-containing protein n=1 Tax=Monodelphis domestica TaxID=13616 RepID=F6XEP3_MONDO
MEGDMDEEMLHQLYLWVDTSPCPRPILAAEVVKFYFPKMVEMHNYVPANSVQQKVNNWVHLNRKVLHKLNFSVPEDVIQKIAQCSPGVVELVLQPLRERLEERKRKRQGVGSSQVHALGPHSGQKSMRGEGLREGSPSIRPGGQWGMGFSLGSLSRGGGASWPPAGMKGGGAVGRWRKFHGRRLVRDKHLRLSDLSKITQIGLSETRFEPRTSSLSIVPPSCTAPFLDNSSNT